MHSFQQFTEAASVKTQKYSWGTMKTVHHGASFSIPLHPEHHQAIHKLKDGESHSFTDETKSKWKATREGDKVHFHGEGPGNRGYKTTVSHEHMKEEVEIEEAKDTVEKDAQGNIKSWKHEGDWVKSKGNGTTVDKSGAKHTPYSKARDLARAALKKSFAKEEVELDEAKSPQQDMDFKRMMSGAMSRDEYNKKWKKGKYAQKSGKHRLDPSGIYHNLIKTVGEEVELTEEKHRVLVTLSDPNHSMTSQRKEKIQKHIRVTAGDHGQAVAKAKAHYQKQGYKVHDAEHVGMVKEEALDEAGAYQKDMDEKKPVYAQGVKGMKSKPFTKKFKTMDHYNKWADSEKSGDHEVHRVYQEEIEQILASAEFAALDEESKNAILAYIEHISEGVSHDSKARYEYSNGKKPSGHGNWMFSTVHPREHDVEKHKDQTVSVQGTFSDASKKAAAHFKSKGHKGEIHVLP